MVKKYIKIFRKYPKDLQMHFIEAISKIEVGDFSNLDITELKGNNGEYRCRIGKFRILFHKNDTGKYIITDIGSRGDIYK